MDPLSVATGVARLASFAYRSLALINTRINGIKSADANLLQLQSDVTALQSKLTSIATAFRSDEVLQLLQRVKSQGTASQSVKQLNEIEPILSGCESTFESLSQLLGDVGAEPIDIPGIPRKPVLGFKINLKSEDLDSVHHRIRSYSSAMDIALQMVGVKMDEHMDRASRDPVAEQRFKLLQSRDAILATQMSNLVRSNRLTEPVKVQEGDGESTLSTTAHHANTANLLVDGVSQKSLSNDKGQSALPLAGKGASEDISKRPEDIHSRASLKDLYDLRATDPRDVKKRLEDASGGLLRDLHRWVFEHPLFHEWINNKRDPLLWINGDPGAGKTMLLCGIIDELKNVEVTTSLSYFFCQATDFRTNNAEAVLRGLIHLLIDQQPSLISHLRAGKSLFGDLNTWHALSEIFTSILQDPGLAITYLIIDALDECEVNLAKLLQLIVQKSPISPRMKWVISSRKSQFIENRLTPCLQIDLTRDRSIQEFINWKISQLPFISPESAGEVRDKVGAMSGGNFLWASLILKHFEALESRNILELLQQIPPGLSSLYDWMIQHVQQQKRENVGLCRLVLSTMSLEGRPINLVELCLLCHLPRQFFSTDPENVKHVVKTCSPFLTVYHEHVYLVHGSAKDFLLKRKRLGIFPFDKVETDSIGTLTVTSRDSGYVSMASKARLESASDTESIASLDSHASASSFNPADVGGAPDQLAEILLHNEVIGYCVKTGFVEVDSDRFARNFARLLKRYAYELREEAETHIQKGATRIIHTYRAYVTRIIRLRVLGSDEDDSKAAAFDNIKHQTPSKLNTLEKYLAQQKIAGTSDVEGKRPQDEQESEGDSLSGDEDLYLPNIADITDFLVSSEAFKNFKVRLEAFVKSNAQIPQQTPDLRSTESDEYLPTNQDQGHLKWHKDEQPRQENMLDLQHEAKYDNILPETDQYRASLEVPVQALVQMQEGTEIEGSNSSCSPSDISELPTSEWEEVQSMQTPHSRDSDELSLSDSESELASGDLSESLENRGNGARDKQLFMVDLCD